MRHTCEVMWVGQIIDPVKVQAVQTQKGQSQVARTRISMVKSVNGRDFRQSWLVEGWGDIAQRFAGIPVGHDVAVGGELENYSFDDANGNKKYGVKLKVFKFVADCGPSEHAMPQPHGQAPNQFAPQQGQTNAPTQQWQPQGQQQQQQRYQPPPQQWGGQQPQGTFQPQQQAPQQAWTPPAQNGYIAPPPQLDQTEQIPF